MRGKNRLVDMTQGPLVPNLVRFAFPLLLAGLLQLTFNAADVIVVGRCVGDTALAAVTSSSPLINMLLGIFLGLSMGGNVVVARALGREDRDGTERAVHTCIATGIWCGLLISALGLIFSPLLLRLMAMRLKRKWLTLWLLPLTLLPARPRRPRKLLLPTFRFTRPRASSRSSWRSRLWMARLLP